MLTLKNPHSVLAALQARPKDVREIRLSAQTPHGVWKDVVELAESLDVNVTRGRLLPAARRGTRDGGRTSATEARVTPREPYHVEDLFGADPPADGLWLALDCLQDPHNVGAVFRTAAFFGIRGVLLTRDRSASLTNVVYDIASGGMEHVPFAQPSNLRQALQIAQRQGIWILGASEHADKDIRDVPRDRARLLVVGNEQTGLRRLTLETCDELCRISRHGAVGSLNVSVATGILLSQLRG